MKTFALATAALGLAVTATPAFAGPADNSAQNISVSGIDLNSEEGKALLEQRIDMAAKRVCNLSTARTGTRLKTREARTCFNKARASAKRQAERLIEDERLGG